MDKRRFEKACLEKERLERERLEREAANSAADIQACDGANLSAEDEASARAVPDDHADDDSEDGFTAHEAARITTMTISVSYGVTVIGNGNYRYLNYR